MNLKQLKEKIQKLEKETFAGREREERIQHLYDVLNSIWCVNRLITREKNKQNLIQGICEILILSRSYHNAWIALTNRSCELMFAGENSMAEPHIEIIRNLLLDGTPPDCCKRESNDNSLKVIEDPSTTCRGCPVAPFYNGRGAFSIQLIHGNRVYGILTVSTPKKFSFDTEEQELFKNFAADISHALNSLEEEEKRRQMERELRQARDELEARVKERTRQLERLSSKLLNAQEEERKRIAGDLHDGIGQFLSAAKFILENALDSLRPRLAPSEIEPLHNLVPMLRETSEEVRTIVMNLRPSMLDDLGIMATISWFCRQFKQIYSSLEIMENIRCTERDIPDHLKTIIFRIIQEAMNNVVKHSRATRVVLGLCKTNGRIELCIQDNGKGFDLTGKLFMESMEKGFGITGMKERTEISGGSFHIHSGQGKGTEIKAVWNEKDIGKIIQ